MGAPKAVPTWAVWAVPETMRSAAGVSTTPPLRLVSAKLTGVRFSAWAVTA